MRGREYRNDVMHEAFSRLDVGDSLHTSLVKNISRAFRRFKPSPYGGWRVTNKRRGKRVNRNR